ncbi:ATP-binding cassette transporter subunit [Streptococcus equi subsp. equi]|nr:ATP-binding cassette transporter subunit [Streptococcus equi subsp. equi]CRS35016.1 ATP-binding cassette transporter subunit [Streptococcus equi subsp. equi]CRS36815.1 ATP-binding cassette transporter subunit [Streptococcus equi subsp. equi]CRS37601.1 ATP-binding cassette transporter subunit [Streptococcus equi subsp. equi]CRS99770.1 ATP-binding cassette transporter subunit [Streptococcus equi subsp. equi]
MNPNLFRSAEFYQRRYHNFAIILIIPLILFVIFLLSFSFLGQKEVTVSSRGEIMPTKVIPDFITCFSPHLTQPLGRVRFFNKF